MIFQVILVLFGTLTSISSQPFPETKMGARIVGGYPIEIELVPYQLFLLLNSTFNCGAVLISRDLALTAAHCVDDFGNYSVGFGSKKIENDKNLINVDSIIVHPYYKDYDYDIAVIGLAKRVNFSDKIQPAKLPNDGDEAKPGTKMLVSGWGVSNEYFTETEKDLRATEVPIIDKNICQRLFSYLSVITPRMICAGPLKGGKDSCHGDSGGPLVRKSDKVLFGIVSWGFGCARPYSPGIYANVASVRRWIRDVTGQ